MVGLLGTGFPLANQPFVHPNGQLTQAALTFLQNLWGNATSTTLPSGLILPPGSVTSQSFAPFLAPVGFGQTLPNPATYSSTTPLFFQESDGKLYRLVNGAWTAAIPAIDITGQLTANQLADAAVTAGKLASGAVGAPNLQAGSVGAVAIAVDELSAISANLGTVTVGTMTAGTSYLGAVSAGQIVTTSLSAISANLGTINAGTLNSVTVNSSTIESATSGTRVILDNAGNITAFSGSSSNAGFAYTGSTNSLVMRDSSNQTLVEMGQGFTSAITAIGSSADGQSYGLQATAPSSGGYAINCNVGGLQVAGQYTFTGSGSILNNGSQDFLNVTSGTFFIGNTIDNIAFNNTIVPASSTYNVGTNALPWHTAFFTVAPTIVSDLRAKKNIRKEILGKEFILRLNPIMYELIGKASGYHHGFIAQEVEEALKDVSFLGLSKPSLQKEMYGLKYEEFIAPMVSCIQTQQNEIDELRDEVSSLKELIKELL